MATAHPREFGRGTVARANGPAGPKMPERPGVLLWFRAKAVHSISQSAFPALRNFLSILKDLYRVLLTVEEKMQTWAFRVKPLKNPRGNLIPAGLEVTAVGCPHSDCRCLQPPPIFLRQDDKGRAHQKLESFSASC